MNFIIRNIYKYNDVIDKYCIYLGDSDNSNQIIVAEVGAIDSTRQYRPISCLTNMVMFIDKILFIHPNTTISPLFIKGKIASITPSEFYDLLKDLCKNILNVYETDILKLIDNNYDSVNDKIIDVKFSEKLLRFLIWTDKKEKLKFLQKNNVKNVIQNNVYWAYMGCNLGCEIEKLRPVLIWKEHINFTNTNENSYFVFPISSKIPKKKYYYNIESIKGYSEDLYQTLNAKFNGEFKEGLPNLKSINAILEYEVNRNNLNIKPYLVIFDGVESIKHLRDEVAHTLSEVKIDGKDKSIINSCMSKIKELLCEMYNNEKINKNYFNLYKDINKFIIEEMR